jgi:hypothetical protein
MGYIYKMNKGIGNLVMNLKSTKETIINQKETLINKGKLLMEKTWCRDNESQYIPSFIGHIVLNPDSFRGIAIS